MIRTTWRHVEISRDDLSASALSEAVTIRLEISVHGKIFTEDIRSWTEADV